MLIQGHKKIFFNMYINLFYFEKIMEKCNIDVIVDIDINRV